MNKLLLQQSLRHFLNEDIQTGDVTSEVIFAEEEQGEAYFIAKESGIICGLSLIQLSYQQLTSQIKVTLHKKDGDYIAKGDILATVYGPIRHILTGERVILNLLQRLSSIASLTNKAILTLNDPHTKICDTRKTTPGLRMLEKYAVRIGGGLNHRFGLYDGVLIKDNHIYFAGSIRKAVQRVRENANHMLKISVEVETKEQLLEAIDCEVDAVLIDNQSPHVVKKWVSLVPNSITTEASGGIQLNNLKKYQGTNVDLISLGFISHSAQSLDISLMTNI